MDKSLEAKERALIKLIDANLEYYNATCLEGFELTKEDLIAKIRGGQKEPPVYQQIIDKEVGCLIN